MAKYNAAKHTIESDTGELLAKLSDSVRADKAFDIADAFDGTTFRQEIEGLKEENAALELSEREARNETASKVRQITRLDLENTKQRTEISTLLDRITELEALLAEKGDAQ